MIPDGRAHGEYSPSSEALEEAQRQVSLLIDAHLDDAGTVPEWLLALDMLISQERYRRND
jgi:hypothetical protein